MKFKSTGQNQDGSFGITVVLPVYRHRSRKRLRHIRRQNFRKLFKMPPMPQWATREIVEDPDTGLLLEKTTYSDGNINIQIAPQFHFTGVSFISRLLQ